MTTTGTTATPISASEAEALLREWASSALEVGVSYAISHSEGGVLLKGRVHLENDLLRVTGRSSVLHVSISKADFGHGPVTLVGRGGSVSESAPGLHIMTRHGDWLFVAPRFDPALAPPRLPG